MLCIVCYLWYLLDRIAEKYDPARLLRHAVISDNLKNSALKAQPSALSLYTINAYTFNLHASTFDQIHGKSVHLALPGGRARCK